MRRFAETHGDALVNPYPAFVNADGDGSDLFLDEIHPTARGHALIAGAVWSALEKIARSLDPSVKPETSL
ncbi:MAG: SGNH/GDSL hydrolase family protein [Deltaproteobacteria bacterium]|nr:SGNH/GDSL hydrolase family protein [Deltaproteobacteria bacterium]